MTLHHPEGWKVGMTVHSVMTRNQRNGPKISEVTITKIGRKWIYFGEGYQVDRFDAETCQIDGKGYSSPGKVYENLDKYLSETARDKSFQHLRFAIGYSPSIGVTSQDIVDACKLLRLPEPKETY